MRRGEGSDDDLRLIAVCHEPVVENPQESLERPISSLGNGVLDELRSAIKELLDELVFRLEVIEHEPAWDVCLCGYRLC